MQNERSSKTGLRGTSTGFVTEEFIPQLRGQPGMRQYREMADNDPVIGALLHVSQMLVRGVEWRLEPADKSSAALDGAEFAEQVLMKDMAVPFSSVIEDAMSMLPYGFAPMEMVFKKRSGFKRGLDASSLIGYARPEPPAPSSLYDDNRIGIDRLQLISQESVWRWFFDATGNWYALEQLTEDDGGARIPRDKMMLFRTQSRLNNPEGRSIMRNSYVPYMRKKTLEIAEGRIAMRSAGIVLLRVPAAYMDPNAPDNIRMLMNEYKTLAESAAQDRQGSIILPSDTSAEGGHRLFDLEYVTADTRRPADQSAVIERLDRRIAGTVAADFLLLGQSQVGSFALADSKTNLFATSLGGYLKSIAAEFNRVLLPKLWRLNGLDLATMPELKHGDLDQRDLAGLSQFISSMVSAGAAFFPDRKLQDHLLTMADLPTSEETDPPTPEEMAQAVSAGQGGEGDTDKAKKEEAK